MKTKVIFLCGFMGSGKSTVGSLLARMLNCEFEDLDETIVAKEGHSIAEIFNSRGESAFREIEAQTLKGLNVSNRRVIALGGGTLLSEASRDFIMKRGILIYLSAEPESIAKRLDRSSELRPIFSGLTPAQRDLKIRELMIARSQIYELAPIRVITDGRQPLEIATDISRMVTHAQFATKGLKKA